jgi:hypothetical protein
MNHRRTIVSRSRVIVDAGTTSVNQSPECLFMYSVYRVEPREPMGHARTLDQILLLAEAGGPGRFEIVVAGDVPKHLCFVARHEDGTITLDPRQAGSLGAVLGGTLTRA